MIPMLLPIPMFNVLNGESASDSGLSVSKNSDCLPKEFPGMPNSFVREVGNISVRFEGFILAKAGYSTSVGDEGGFAPRLEVTRSRYV